MARAVGGAAKKRVKKTHVTETTLNIMAGRSAELLCCRARLPNRKTFPRALEPGTRRGSRNTGQVLIFVDRNIVVVSVGHWMKSQGIDPFVHEAAAIGHSNAARSVVLTAWQLTKFTRSVCISIAIVEDAIIDAVGVFIHDEPTGTGARIEKIAGLLGPPKSGAVRK